MTALVLVQARRARVPRKVATAVILLVILPVIGGMAQRQPARPSRGPQLGRVEPGAATLAGYLVQNTPCIPLKKFGQDAGYYTSVSPSRRGVAIQVGSKVGMVVDRARAIVDGKEFTLALSALERDGDFFVPLEFYNRLIPNAFTYDSKTRTVKVTLPHRTLTVPIKPLPDEKKKPASAAPLRTNP